MLRHSYGKCSAGMMFIGGTVPILYDGCIKATARL